MSPDNSAGMPSAATDPMNIRVAAKEGTTLFSHEQLQVLMQMPLPGITIFVHGVNSDGEWFEAAEQGLCKGLNRRLARLDEHLKYTGPEAGQLSPAGYMQELTPAGFINPKMSAKSFIQTDDSFSPVIRFRWGYKASAEELQQYGKSIYLNEQDYWGGGPFANGCSSLPDLWGRGLEDELFLFLHVQHMNPTNDRTVYSCPPRPYFVLAAHRLAKLVESIRRKQADVPITIVCHSQGNMIGMAAAFLGDRMPAVTDVAGHSGRCVADAYVLCNPPYSLVESNATENWTQRHTKDPEGRRGRQTLNARTRTLAAFFDIVRQRAPLHQDGDRIDKRMSNKAHGFDAISDRAKFGLNLSTYGRVTLYCNPHDRVISSTTVQGIGWRGMSADEISATGGHGVFTQRVFSEKFPVGRQGCYDYWADQYNKPKAGSSSFWTPESPSAKYSIMKGLEASNSIIGSIMTFAAAPIPIGYGGPVKSPINALPPTDWKIPLEAPPLAPFLPQAFTNGMWRDEFDQFYDAPGMHRNAQSILAPGDPYAGVHTNKDGSLNDAPHGNEQSEAALRYENHAQLRMQARRDGRYASDAPVLEEDAPTKAGASYTAWRTARIQTYLAANIDTHATDHSTTMTNPDHAEKALAYDVAIGNCDIVEKDLNLLRIAADWRFVQDLPPANLNKIFSEYFAKGKFNGVSPYAWSSSSGSEGTMPTRIVDERDGATYLY